MHATTTRSIYVHREYYTILNDIIKESDNKRLKQRIVVLTTDFLI